MGFQFEPVRELRQSHFGLFWERIRDTYPDTSDHPRLETPVVSFDPLNQEPSFRIEMVGSLPAHRSWFVSGDDERLIQLQDDRLIHNWRHRGGPYPRFESLHDDFSKAVEHLRFVLTDSGLDTPQPRQVEVTYINWLPGGRLADYLRPVAECSVSVDGVGPEPEFEAWSAGFPVKASEMIVGRLKMESKPGARGPDGAEQGHLLTLTYVAPLGLGVSDKEVDEHLHKGRDVIVRSFSDITEESMHQIWGRK